MEANELRIILAIGGAILLLLIYLYGRPRKPDQGQRWREPRATPAERREPAFGEAEDGSMDSVIQAELERLERTLAGEHQDHDVEFPAPARRAGFRDTDVDDIDAMAEPNELPLREPERAPPPQSTLGKRVQPSFEKVVSLIVAARADTRLRGSDLIVAAEKAGLVYGDMQIFHRLVDGKPELGPVFSVASVVKPGSFDLSRSSELETPGITFFMTLPGPLSALDAWDTMLPAAQRMAELLDAVLLDDARNALGRQRIAFIRDELRAFDREQEKQSKRRW
jgi:cell division protein ZipA